MEDANAAALELRKQGCHTVIITLGKNGAIFLTPEMTTSVHVPCEPVQAVDTTVSYRIITFNGKTSSHNISLEILNPAF